MHADMTIHGKATVEILLDLASLNPNEELVYVDCVRDMKFRSGICFISKELADALDMKQGQRGQLNWQS